jgi:glycolate oxidase FAD binding subunit
MTHASAPAAPVSPQSVSELAALVREFTRESVRESARESARALRIVGGGTWLDAGHADPDATPLHLSAFRGIHAYVPADLTISVGAATTLAELDAATRAHGQWCPLLPWGDDAGTVGATIATATTGPFADSLGRPRDLVLGLEVVDGLGRIVQAGGRVVKNVAGFDLTRLMTGAWGTLGVITAVHLRLRARPAVDESWIVRGGEPAATPMMQAIARGPYAPLATVPLTPRLAAMLGAQVDPGWLVRLGGNAAFVRAARAQLTRVGAVEEVAAPETAWATIRRAMAPSPVATAWKWDALSRRVKSQFDPRDVLNRGLLGAAS